MAALSFPVSEPNGGTATVVGLPEALLVAALVSRVGKHWHLCRLYVNVLAKGDTTVTMIV